MYDTNSKTVKMLVTSSLDIRLKPISGVNKPVDVR